MSKQIVDKSSIVVPFGTMEDFKRPNHTDFMDSGELRKMNWSGLRHNSLSDCAELWLLGEIKETVTAEQVMINPMAINEAYERVFCLVEVMPDTPAAKEYVKARDQAGSFHEAVQEALKEKNDGNE